MAGREWANIWPQGGLFAFSGVDGETAHGEPFVAAGAKEGLGWRFWLSPPVTMLARLGDVNAVPQRHPDDVCLSDCWRCSVAADGCAGTVTGAFVDRASLTVRMAFDAPPEGALPSLAVAVDGCDSTRPGLIAGAGWWLAIVDAPEGGGRRFGVAISYAGETEAVARAQHACAADFDAVFRERAAFYERVDAPESLTGDFRRAFYKAVSILKVNTESAQLDIPCRWSTPDRMPHRHMWLWDTAFAALGLQHLEQDLAEDALRALAAKQHDDGRYALAACPEPPGAKGAADQRIAGGESQPPIVAWAAWLLFERTGHVGFLRELYPSLVRYIEWFENHRKNANGLYGWIIRTDNDPVRGARGGESGMDNSPRFDTVSGMTAVDLAGYMANEYGYLAEMAEILGRAEERGEWARRRARIIEAANASLWDDDDQFYYDRDPDGAFIRIKTVAGLVPLLAGIPSPDRAEALRAHITNPRRFWTPLPVPSVAGDESSFSRDMWRGPVWPNVNLLVYYGLKAYGFAEEARALAHTTMDAIARWYERTGCFFEYYDATGQVPPPELPRKGGIGTKGGVGFGVVADLNWTASVYVHLAHETA